jgi:hypothetical protein
MWTQGLQIRVNPKTQAQDCHFNRRFDILTAKERQLLKFTMSTRIVCSGTDFRSISDQMPQQAKDSSAAEKRGQGDSY